MKLPPLGSVSKDGRTVTYPVPTSPVPGAQCLAFVRSPVEDPNRIEHATLLIPRERVSAYANWMAETGGADREPNAEELDVIMKAAATMLAEAQLEVFSAIGELIIHTLGDGDTDAATVRIAETWANKARRKAIAAGASPEDADREALDMVRRVRQMVEDGRRNSEGGAA
jgi:hypothetical protein